MLPESSKPKSGGHASRWVGPSGPREPAKPTASRCPSLLTSQGPPSAHLQVPPEVLAHRPEVRDVLQRRFELQRNFLRGGRTRPTVSAAPAHTRAGPPGSRITSCPLSASPFPSFPPGARYCFPGPRHRPATIPGPVPRRFPLTPMVARLSAVPAATATFWQVVKEEEALAHSQCGQLGGAWWAAGLSLQLSCCHHACPSGLFLLGELEPVEVVECEIIRSSDALKAATRNRSCSRYLLKSNFLSALSGQDNYCP